MKRDCTILVAKTKALISFEVTAKLICVFVFAYARNRFSHDEAHIIFAVNSVDADQAIGTLRLVGIFDVCLDIIQMCMERSGVSVFAGSDLVRQKLEMVLFRRRVRGRCL